MNGLFIYCMVYRYSANKLTEFLCVSASLVLEWKGQDPKTSGMWPTSSQAPLFSPHNYLRILQLCAYNLGAVNLLLCIISRSDTLLSLTLDWLSFTNNMQYSVHIPVLAWFYIKHFFIDSNDRQYFRKLFCYFYIYQLRCESDCLYGVEVHVLLTPHLNSF